MVLKNTSVANRNEDSGRSDYELKAHLDAIDSFWCLCFEILSVLDHLLPWPQTVLQNLKRSLTIETRPWPSAISRTQILKRTKNLSTICFMTLLGIKGIAKKWCLNILLLDFYPVEQASEGKIFNGPGNPGTPLIGSGWGTANTERSFLQPTSSLRRESWHTVPPCRQEERLTQISKILLGWKIYYGNFMEALFHN